MMQPMLHTSQGCVQPSGNNGAMVFVVKSGTAKIHYPYCCILHTPFIPFLLQVVGELIVRIHKQDVFWLEVRMCQLVVMEELDGLTQLEGHVAHLVDGVGQVVVVFEEVESAEAQELEGDTHVAMVVKPVKHLDTQVLIVWVLFIDLLQHIDFQSCCLFVLFHILNDL